MTFTFSRMTRSQQIQFIFSPPPHYGLRGDPSLWKWIQVRFENEKQWTADSFEKMIVDTFTLLTGEIPQKGKNFYIQQLNLGGMSGGMISSDYWIDVGFPLLIDRFRQTDK